MDVERITKYCEKCISDEESKNLPSDEKIKAFQQILGFIQNTAHPMQEEIEEFKKVWQKHHKSHKGTLYVFNKKEDNEINGILRQIKEEMLLNQQVYGNMTTGVFLDLLLTNCDTFWKDRTFHTWTFNEKFRKILSPVLNQNRNYGGQKNSSQKKPSYQDVMEKNYFGEDNG